jgi:tRNA(fMet)-specific endonuclease VapC
MIILPDTNAWIKLLNQGDTPVKGRFVAANPDAIRLCSVVKAELYFGAYKSARKKHNLSLLERLFKVYASLPFDDQAAKIYGNLRADLTSAGCVIGPNDLLIASIALAHRATLITDKEFHRGGGIQSYSLLNAVEKLSVEDQEALIDVIRKRIIEYRRSQLAHEVRQAQQEFKAGKCLPASTSDIIGKILL